FWSPPASDISMPRASVPLAAIPVPTYVRGVQNQTTGWLCCRVGMSLGAGMRELSAGFYLVEREAMANGDGRRPALLTAEDENAVRSILARLCDAWARGDSRAYAACFAENSDYITFNGMHLRGRTENAKLHGALF